MYNTRLKFKISDYLQLGTLNLLQVFVSAVVIGIHMRLKNQFQNVCIDWNNSQNWSKELKWKFVTIWKSFIVDQNNGNFLKNVFEFIFQKQNLK